MAIVLILPDLYPICIIGVIWACCYNNTYLMCCSKRKKVFNDEFMEQFEQEHAIARPGETLKGSYGSIDQGNGYYSQHLKFKDWHEFNVQQRINANAWERLPIIMILVPIAGIWLPVPTLVGIWSYNFARLTYACTYTKSPKHRTGPAINLFI